MLEGIIGKNLSILGSSLYICIHGYGINNSANHDVVVALPFEPCDSFLLTALKRVSKTSTIN